MGGGCGPAVGDDLVFRKCAWRLIPLVSAAYAVNYIDRTNVGFAALTMNRDLGFSPSVYGFGAGIFFLSYSLFQLPANVALNRIGARRWLCFILAGWGVASASGALIRGPFSFYTLRLLLGVAEAGLLPGVLLYLTFWFPKAWLCRANSFFLAAYVAASVVGGPLASLILSLNRVAGIRGWQWLFLLEGVLPLLLAIAVLLVLPDRPADALWLSDAEKRLVAERIRQEDAHKQTNLLRALWDPRVFLLGIAHACWLVSAYGLAFWLPLVIQGMGFSNIATGLTVGAMWSAALPVMIFWGRSSDRSGERFWHAAIPAITISAGMAVAALGAGNATTFVALAATVMMLSSWSAPFYSLPPLFLSGPAMAGGIAVLNGTANLLGGFAGQYLVGVLREQSGGYTVPFAVMSGVALIAAVIVLSLGRSIAPARVPVPVAAQ
jgi:MFS transporter, ACS family, tartrate transporter